MTKLLSLLLCIALLLSCTAFAEPAAEEPISGTITLKDLSLTLFGETYPIRPSATLGGSVDGENILLDFHIDSDGRQILPIQGRLNADSASVLLGDSANAYTFSSALLFGGDPAAEGAELPNLPALLYEQLRTPGFQMPEYTLPTVEETMKMRNEFNTAYADAVEATFTVNGEEVKGTHYSLSLDHDEAMAYIDESMKKAMPEFYEAYFEFLNQMLRLSFGGQLVNLSDSEAPEIRNFADLYRYLGIEYSVVGEYDATDTYESGTLNSTFRILQFDEETSFTLPIEYTMVFENGTLVMDYTAEGEVDGTALHLDAHAEQSDAALKMAFVLTDNEAVTMNCDLAFSQGENGDWNLESALNQTTDYTSVGLTLNGTSKADDVTVSAALNASESGLDEAVEGAFNYHKAPDSSAEINASLSVPDASAMAADYVRDAAGAYNFSFNFEDSFETVLLSANAEPEKNGITEHFVEGSVRFDYGEEYGVAFTLVTDKAPLTDRISSAANQIVIANEDDMNNSSLPFEFMIAMGEVGMLSTEESIANLSNALFPSEPAQIESEPTLVPSFRWLPDGFDSPSFTFGDGGIIHAVITHSVTGEVMEFLFTPMEDPSMEDDTIHGAYLDDGSISVTCAQDGYLIEMLCPGSISTDVISNIYNGIVFEETASDPDVSEPEQTTAESGLEKDLSQFAKPAA